jgi:serine/threonine-protein kinase
MLYQARTAVESLGPYRLTRIIGQGAMSSVFLAETESGEVALKRLHPQLSRYPEQVALFAAEARLARQFSHENLVHAFDAGDVGDHHFIAMELVRGPNLAQSLERSRPSPRTTARIIRSLCRGLSAVHRAGIVHGDVTPTNVLVGGDGMVKLTDFGVATPAGTSQPEVRGTYAYMSPEQARGQAIDPRSDLFSVGVLLWELWTGERLFRRKAPYLTLAAVVEEEPPPVGDSERDALLRKALAKEPALRFASAGELAAALRALTLPEREQ